LAGNKKRVYGGIKRHPKEMIIIKPSEEELYSEK
jgi:hypothetical protein